MKDNVIKIGLRERVRNAAKAFSRDTFVMPKSEHPGINGIMGLTQSGVAVNLNSAQKFSAVFSCIRIYETVMGSLPIRVTGNVNGSLADLTDGPTYNLLHQPNKYMNRYTFMALMNAWLQVNGNAVAVIIHDKNGYPVELVPVEWSSVDVRLIDRMPVYLINDKNTGIKGTYLYWQVIHFKINSRNGYMGNSPLSFAKESVGMGLAAQEYGAEFFAKGGNLKGVIEGEGHMKDEEFKAFKQRWQEHYTGAGSNQEVPILEYGLKYKALGIAPQEAQFVESRIFQIQDVARFYGLPPSIIGENSRNTFLNGEQQDIQYVKYALAPLCKSEELELEFKLIPLNAKKQENIKFNLDGLQRGDMNARSRYEQTLVQAGILTRNEAREIENRPPLPGLDKPLEPAFLTGKQNTKPENKE